MGEVKYVEMPHNSSSTWAFKKQSTRNKGDSEQECLLAPNKEFIIRPWQYMAK